MIDDRNDLEFITDDIDTVSTNDIYTISEESVDEVSEVSKMTMGRKVSRAADPAPETVIGRFNVLRTVGGSETTSYGSNEFAPQGTVEVSFTLSGDILSLAPTNSTTGPLHNNKYSLSTLIQNAYQETIKDANVGFTLSTVTNREKLSSALYLIFGGSSQDANSGLKFIFNSDGRVKSVAFNKEACFPTSTVCPDYIRHIIDLDAMNTIGIGKNKSTSSEDIPIKMMIRVKDPSQSSTVPLQTNTNYSFVGIENDKYFQVNSTAGDFVLQPASSKLNVIDFKLNNFKTEKASAYIVTKLKDSKSGSPSTVDIVYKGSTGEKTDTYAVSYVYLNTIKKSEKLKYKHVYPNFIDMKAITERSGVTSSGDLGSVVSTLSAFHTPIEVTGTSIKIKPLQFKDPDSTITKIEVEDNRGQLYKAKLSVDSSDSKLESGVTFLEVTDLQRSMPYTFTKIHLTSNHGDKEELKTLHFISYPDTTGSWTGTGIQVNTLPIRTAHFYGPKLVLANDPIKTGNDLNNLPDGLKVKSVKNDRTALRYIIKPDNTEGTLGDITINGLRDEKYKIEKVLDKDGKISYWILTLYNLLPDYDYSFLILELSYTDLNGNKSITRQALSEINKTISDTKYDNRTEKTALQFNEQFEIVVNDKVEAKDPRSVDVPVFVDDIHGKFAGIEMTPPKEHPGAKAVYETGKIKFSSLTPEKTGVFRVDFLHNPDADNNSTYEFRNSNIQRIARYITITTPKVSDLDIKSATATVDMTTAEFKFEYYSDPKSPIKTVVVKDSAGKEMKSSFDKTTNVLKLEGLTEDTKYSKVKVTFTLENSKTIDYTLEDFTTKKKEEAKPTGKVAEFVAKVYKLALGREPEVEGWKFWVQKLESKELAVTQFIYDLMKQDEFVSRLMSREQFIKMMYEIIVGREPEEEGQKYWEQKYEEYRTQEPTLADVRMRIAREMMDTAEFKAYVASLGLKY